MRYEDSFHDHDKVLAVVQDDVAALALHLLANTWTASTEWPGWIPARKPVSLVGARGGAWADILAKAGLWEVGEHDGRPGWWVHDYPDYNFDRAQWDAYLKDKRDRASNGGKKSAQMRAAAQAESKRNPSGSQAEGKPDPTGIQAEAKPESGVVVVVVDEVPKEQKTLAPKSAARREPDKLWDAVVDACGINANEITEAMRGSVAKAVADLRAVQATPNQVTIRARRYRTQMPNARLTPPALAKHWATLSVSTNSVTNETHGGW